MRTESLYGSPVFLLPSKVTKKKKRKEKKKEKKKKKKRNQNSSYLWMGDLTE